MNIGIIGAGQIGGNLARLWAAKHQLMISFSRSPEKLRALAQEAGPQVQVGTPTEAAQFADVLVLSVHFAALDEAIRQLGEVTGKVLIDTNNPFDIQLPAGTTGAQEILRRLPGVRLVKAFNTMGAPGLLAQSHRTPRLIMPISGDTSAKATVAGLVTDAGFAPFDLGTLEATAQQEPGGPYYAQELTLEQAEQQFAQARI